MSQKKKKKSTEHKQFIYVSRDRLCSQSLIFDNTKTGCKLPYHHSYEDEYTVVYNIKHLEAKTYECGCLVYHNKHYPEFKYPHLIWMDFFYEGVEKGQKNVKFVVRKCAKR